jgi:transcription antitermination protein NusB
MVRARTKARKRALDILFESEARGDDPVEVLAQRRATDDAPPVSEYAAMLVEGVVAHRERIDQLLAEHAEGWTVARMPAVDRNLLRIGLFELLWADDVPDAVAISEAVELAGQLSTDESPGFVNGLLARILELKPSLSR